MVFTYNSVLEFKDIFFYTMRKMLKGFFDKYGTNKSWHGYHTFYEKLFENKRSTITHFFEIGISNGSSMFAWKDYFPNSIIYGCDLQIPECVKDVDRLVPGIADQSNPDALLNIIDTWNSPSFDCILDDGGHFVKQQRISIETLWKYVKPGGYYVIEDLHTNIRELHTIHPHMNSESKFIDETPTVHHKLINTMCGSKKEFYFSEQIDEILYFSNPNTLSLSCCIKKK